LSPDIQGETPPNGLPTSHIGSIDQLNAAIAGQLKTITPPPGGGSLNNNPQSIR
jgi:hypothetical protein